MIKLSYLIDNFDVFIYLLKIFMFLKFQEYDSGLSCIISTLSNQFTLFQIDS